MAGNNPQSLIEALTAWESADLAESIKRVPERPETQAFQRLHTPLDAGPQPPDEAEQQWYLDKLGFPGQYPFTRRAADHVPQPLLDDAPVRWLWHGR